MRLSSVRQSLTSSLALLALLSSLLLTCTAQAGSFRVSPLRVDFSEQNQTTQLTIENLSLHMVTLQTSVMRWQQQGEQDELVPSKDIFVSPPIMMLPPRGRQTIRLRHLAELPEQQEQAYRLYLQDTAARAQHGGGANLAVRMGLPMFVTPRDARPEPQLSSHYQDGTWRVVISNTGNAHLRVHGVDAFSANADRNKLTKDDFLGQVTQATDGFPYVLAKQTREWHIKAPANAQLRLRTNVYGYRQQGFNRRGVAWLGEPENNKKN